MQYRNIKDFNNNLTSLFSVLGISGKYKIIGSSNIKNIRYNSDYDLESQFEVQDKNPESIYKKIYQHFKDIFISASKDPNQFIIDLKCGVDSSGEPIRWKKNNILNGEDKFIEALKQKSTIKLDLVYLLNGSFTEISDNYYLKVGNCTNFEKPTKKNIKKSVEEDYNTLIQNGNYYKALKRRFILNKLGGKKNDKLIEFFNSSIGILNKAKSDIDTLIILFEQSFRPVKLDDIRNALQQIKQNLSYNLELDLSSEIDAICKIKNRNEMEKVLVEVRTVLNNYINARAKKDFF